MTDVNVSDPREQRKFGLLMAVALAVLGGIRWWLKGVPSPIIFTAALVLLIASVFAPFALRPLFAIWMKLSEALNWMMTRVLLTMAFYGLITPARFLNQVFGSDPLKRDWLLDAASYWETPEEQPADRERYRNQF